VYLDTIETLGKEMTFKQLKRIFLLISFLFIHFIYNLAYAETINGTIDSVIKGDTITIISNGKKIEIRLFGIDTPEKTQAFGQTARNFTGGKASKGEIRVEPITKDQESKIVAIVFVNGVNLNEQIVNQGFGWVDRQHCKESFCADWLKLESNAKAAHKGLWSDANPTPPWEYRKNKRSDTESYGLELVTIPSANIKIAPSEYRNNQRSENESSGVEMVAIPSTTSKIAPSGSTAAYHGDTKKHVFHSSACKEFKCPTCSVNFNSISEALDADYRPHFECITK
jgi:endonuclease YncB( thermonuclease family)